MCYDCANITQLKGSKVISLRCFLKNLHSRHEFYTTAGRTGRAKYQLCFNQLSPESVVFVSLSSNGTRER